ncbi:MAG: class IV adenylate cyclase [Anaerolinea sp.]|nr:class IV adenylate cyclase [Anaerolinea sp.]
MAKLHETELKLYYPDLDALRARIEAAGAQITAPRVYEKNIRFDAENGWLSTTSTVLRLRYDTRARLTYKDGEKIHGNFGSTRFEAEVEVSDLETMQIILERLGFQPVFIYEKYRTTYQLGDAELMLDELPYGNFVEIEADETSIRRVVKQFGLEGAQRYTNSYSVLFRIAQQNMGWSFNDLTFDNFIGIKVGKEAFKGAV